MKNKLMKILAIVTLIVALPIVAAFDGKVAKENDLQVKGLKDIAEVENEIKERVPETYAIAEEKVQPIRNRYLLWTRDGRHIMWGNYGNGFFIGEDNNDKRAWGIYGKKIFAGFYDGEFFWGKYSGGRWTAYGLFGLERSSGRFVLFRNLPTAEAVTN